MNREIDIIIRDTFEPAANEKCLARYAGYRFDGNELFKMRDDYIKERVFLVLNNLRKELDKCLYKEV